MTELTKSVIWNIFKTEPQRINKKILGNGLQYFSKIIHWFSKITTDYDESANIDQPILININNEITADIDDDLESLLINSQQSQKSNSLEKELDMYKEFELTSYARYLMANKKLNRAQKICNFFEQNSSKFKECSNSWI